MVLPTICKPRPAGSHPHAVPVPPPHLYPPPSTLAEEKPLTRRRKFHWPSFVDFSGTAAVCFYRKRTSKSRLFGCFCSREVGGCCFPLRHTGRACAISSTTSAGAETGLNDIFVWNRSLGLCSAPVCSWHRLSSACLRAALNVRSRW